jgi:hypothetical protein
MESNSAAEHLQVIRTLMERSALYRRALAPIMTFAGVVGILAAALGLFLRIESQTGFIGYWMGVALAGVAGAFLLVRRQALKSAEPFWSPPTRRVAQALAPALTAGLLVGVWTYVACSGEAIVPPETGTTDDAGVLFWLPAVWAVFYGCALHAAGFFASRGVRLFGWIFIAVGNAILLWTILLTRMDSPDLPWQRGHWLMGILFGLLQLAYGIYLFLTGEERNEL